jgi:hypothetical protein
VTRQLTPGPLTVEEIDELIRCIVQLATADESQEVERLLGQLATLEALWQGEQHQLTWTPPPGTEDLAMRALEALRSKPKRRRFQRTSS